MPHDGRMTGPRVSIQVTQLFYHIRTQRIQVNVTHQLQQVGIRVAEYGFVAVLKYVTTAAMMAVVVTGVTSQQRRHQFGQGLIPHTDQQVIVIGHHRPCQALGSTACQRIAQAGQEALFVRVSVKNPTAL
jgi:hypothetical protein